ncbi:hypothetical protein ACH5RR_028869 [Cinchona calisaya]|uniref:Disease resistance protein At4g27190-like leucine-rich repeats domain-containing protein n=1 Tax=Cinchona calisaya TaxID=153742 RepID=A0ABD2YR89_9GENT
MEWIITPEWRTSVKLEWLNIEGSRKLISISKGVPPEGTLANLEVLRSYCNSMRNSLSFELVQNLKDLQEIVIENCRRVETIIAATEDIDQINEVNSAEVILPKLQKLLLRSLPALRTICSSVTICDSLSFIEVVKCPELKVLPFFMEIRQQLVDSLKEIKGNRNW